MEPQAIQARAWELTDSGELLFCHVRYAGMPDSTGMSMKFFYSASVNVVKFIEQASQHGLIKSIEFPKTGDVVKPSQELERELEQASLTGRIVV